MAKGHLYTFSSWPQNPTETLEWISNLIWCEHETVWFLLRSGQVMMEGQGHQGQHLSKGIFIRKGVFSNKKLLTKTGRIGNLLQHIVLTHNSWAAQGTNLRMQWIFYANKTSLMACWCSWWECWWWCWLPTSPSSVRLQQALQRMCFSFSHLRTSPSSPTPWWRGADNIQELAAHIILV